MHFEHYTWSCGHHTYLCTVLFTAPTVLWREGRDVLTWKQLFLQESTDHSWLAAAISFILSCSYSSGQKENKTKDDKKLSAHSRSREPDCSTEAEQERQKSCNRRCGLFQMFLEKNKDTQIEKKGRFKNVSRTYFSLIIWNGESKDLGICFSIHSFLGIVYACLYTNAVCISVCAHVCGCMCQCAHLQKPEEDCRHLALSSSIL